MDGALLAVDLSKLAIDAATGGGELALAKDVAQALLHQIGPEKLRDFGAYLVAHAMSHIEAADAFPFQSDEPNAPTTIDESAPVDGWTAHEGP